MTKITVDKALIEQALRLAESIARPTSRGSWNPTTIQLREHCDVLRAALAEPAVEPVKDAARMNWLEQNLFNRENIDPFTKKPCTKFNMWVMFSPKGVQGSARRIIDAAMKEQK